MNKKLFLAACAICILFLSPKAEARDGTVTILSLCRMNSQILPKIERFANVNVSIGGLVQAASVIQQVRTKNPNAILTLGGEAVLGPMWRCFKGEPEFTALNLAGVQVGTIGVHELDYGWDHLKEALQYIRFPMILSNVTISDTKAAKKLRRNIVIPHGSLNVGFFAMLSPLTVSTTRKVRELQVIPNLVGVARGMVADLKSQGADVIIMLSNLTYSENRDVAEGVSGIHAIVGRTLAPDDEVVKPVLVTGPDNWLSVMVWGGLNARSVGQLRLTLKNGRITKEGVEWKHLNANSSHLPPHPAIINIGSEYAQKLDEQLTRFVATFTTPVDVRKRMVRSQETPIGDLITDALLWKFDSDIAFFNGGSIRGDKIFPAGQFSTRDILEIFPMINNFVVLRVSGQQVLDMLETSASAFAAENDGYDASTRTPTRGFLQMSGLRVSYDMTQEPRTFNLDGSIHTPGSRLTEAVVFRNGEWQPIRSGAEYTLALPDWLAEGGNRYGILKDAIMELTGFHDLEILEEYLGTFPNRMVTLQTDGRISIKGRQ